MSEPVVDAEVTDLSTRLARTQLLDLDEIEVFWALAVHVVEEFERRLTQRVDASIAVFARLPRDVSEMPARIFDALCKTDPGNAARIVKLTASDLWVAVPGERYPRGPVVKLAWFADPNTQFTKGISFNIGFFDAYFTADATIQREVIRPASECGGAVWH